VCSTLVTKIVTEMNGTRKFFSYFCYFASIWLLIPYNWMQAIGVDCALEDNRSEDDIIHTVL
jgi:hypothetical protein